MSYRRCWFILVAMIALLSAQAAFAQVVINEIYENPEGSSDEVWEYIELYGRPGMDLTGYAIGLLKGGQDSDGDGVFDSAATVPEIDEAISLDGLTLGSNGFLVLFNDTTGGSNLVTLGLIDPNANAVGWDGLHIPSTDDAGNLENDGSSTYVLVRKRNHHSLDINGTSVYDLDYAFRKDVRHDVNGDGDTDFGTEVAVAPITDSAGEVEHFQVVDEIAWSNAGGKEYSRSRQHEISDTPGFNPDAISRYRYYHTNPHIGYRTVGNSGMPFDIDQTVVADESFIYGEILSSFPPDPGFLIYNTSLDVDNLPRAKAPTDVNATPYDGTCDPEPDDVGNPACLPNASGPYLFTDIDVTGFKLTPGTFNDHPTDANITQFRFVSGDFNFDGEVNMIDRYMIVERLGATLDETEEDVYDAGPPATPVVYQRYVRQEVEFQLVLMMREMDMDDGVGGENADEVTADDLAAFDAICTVCGGTPSGAVVRITEYMYKGNGGEFFELTNLDTVPVDLTGWSFDDDSREVGAVDLSSLGTIAPGESVIVTEDDAAAFAIKWGLVGVKILGDKEDAGMGGNDEINIYDAGGALVDRLTYGDGDFPGTVKTDSSSAWPCDIAVGANDIYNWRLSLLGGDAQGSVFSTDGDVGNPGVFVLDDCTTTIPTGACCTAGVCSEGPQVTEAYCIATGGLYQGDGLTCLDVEPCPQPSNAVIRITEYMYKGNADEFFEVTNLDVVPVDMTGWSFDDSARIQGTFDLSGIGTLAVGESAIVTEGDATAFRAEWSLSGSVKVVGDLGVLVGNNLGRNDEINIFDASGVLVDRLTYGDEDFPGTIRTDEFSGRPCQAFVGANDITQWVLTAIGDAVGSYVSGSGDVGNPGTYVPDPCAGLDPVGACCLIDGSCTDAVTESTCDGLGGTWQGADTECATTSCPQPSDVQMRITEYMYSGTGGEFIEFTNIGDTPIDMTGWSYDDDSRLPGTVDLSAFGTVAPGQSVILTEDGGATFLADWSLSGVTVIGLLTTNIGRADEINLYDENDQLVDRLTYGDSVYPGTIRTQGASGWTCHEKLGANDIHAWVLASVGDAQGSYASSNGDIGNPGGYVEITCPAECSTCMADVDESGTIELADVSAFVDCALGNTAIDACLCADMDESGAIDGLDIEAFVDAVINQSGPCAK